MKNVILGLIMTVCCFGYSYAGECNGSCSVARLPRRIVTLSKEVVSVPVEVTTRTVSRVRRFVRPVYRAHVVETTKSVVPSNQPTLAEPVTATK